MTSRLPGAWWTGTRWMVVLSENGECCEQIPECSCSEIGKPKWKPSIHMPRWASRLTLEITNIRIQRLQDISEEDAIAEGCYSNEQYQDKAGSEGLWPCHYCNGYQLHGALDASMGFMEVDCMYCETAKLRFKILWQSIYGIDSWNANPWVWIIEFKDI